MNKLLNRNIDELTMGEIMAEITDSDKSGSDMEFDMFCNVMGPVLDLPKEEQEKRGFSLMDRDHTGSISAEEFRPLMAVVATQKISPEQANEVLKFTAGPDGNINLKTYQTAVQGKK